jgi:dCTP deaminase
MPLVVGPQFIKGQHSGALDVPQTAEIHGSPLRLRVRQALNVSSENGNARRRPTSVLSDGTIRRLVEEGHLKIEPWDPQMVQPASVDLKLGPSFRVFHNHRIQTIDLADPPQNLTEQVTLENGDTFVIHPNEFVLGRTEEWVELPDDIVARIEGKSSLGRLGLIVHATAGFVDPGFRGTLTLEITNFNSVPIVLRTGLPIAQLSLMALDAPAERPYGHEDLGSHYHGQVEATESRYEGGPAKREA